MTAKPILAPRQPLRRGWPAWYEIRLMGETLTINGATLKVIKRTCCAATDVDPTIGTAI